MRKILLISCFILISGCTTDVATRLDEKTVPDSGLSDNDADAIARINNIKNGATPKVKPTKVMNNDEQTPPSTSKEQQIQLEDLAKEFNGVILKTNMGDIKIKLYVDASSLTVNNFLNLAKKNFYDGTKFHRVIKDFMIQGGDPNSKDDDWSNDGIGGPGYKFQDEFNDHKLVGGSLAMANSGPNTNGSQFFIVTAEATPWLDGKHTNFGEVLEGMDIVKKIEAAGVNENDHPLQDISINSIELIKI
jgi:cyclophilin family peptidyl-prolyl cis-trans isomerase